MRRRRLLQERPRGPHRRLGALCGLVSAIVVLGAAAEAQASTPLLFNLLTGNQQTETTARYAPASASLPNGDVLIAGGSTTNSMTLSSAELFDPTTDTFSALIAAGQSLNDPRSDAATAPLPDGKVLIAGGYVDTSSTCCVLSSAEIFDSATDTFTLVPASMTTPRGLAAAAPLPNGDVLIAGGQGGNVDPTKEVLLGSAEIYDPVAQTFTALTGPNQALTTVRAGPVAAPLPDGKVLIAGGFGPGGYLSSADIYNPVTQTFSLAGHSMATPRAVAAAAPLPGGEVLIAGGQNGSNLGPTALTSVETYDPSTGMFGNYFSNTLARPRYGEVAAALPSGQVLIAGGFVSDNSFNGGEYLSSAELSGTQPLATASELDFAGQSLETTSNVADLVVQGLSVPLLDISTASLGGDNPGDFAIVSNSCAAATLALDQTCAIGVRFAPTTTGLRTATINLSDNELTPISVIVTGTGTPFVPPPPGNPAPTGNPPGSTTGPTGPTGTTPPKVVAPNIVLVACRTTTSKVRGKTVSKRKCTTRKFTSSVSFSAGSATVTLARGHTVYATGTARKADAVEHLTLSLRRSLAAGRYTMTLVYGSGRHRRSVHTNLTVPG